MAKATIKYALVYRGVVTASFIGGTLLVVFGVFAGFWDSINTLLADPTAPGDALEGVNPALTVVFAVLGIALWQFGKAFALFYTLPKAAGAEAARQFDRQGLRSELLEGLSDQLATLEEDVEEIRRSVQELKRTEHAAAFDEETVLDEGKTLDTSSSTSGVAGRRPLDRSTDDGAGADSTHDEREAETGHPTDDEQSSTTADRTDAEMSSRNDPLG